MVKADQCNPNITMEWLCIQKDVTTDITTTIEDFDENLGDVLVDEVKTEILTKSNNSLRIVFSHILVTILIIIIKF